MSDTNPKIAKIRALLTKAENPAASPQEAEALFAKAAELMAKYGVENAMMAATGVNDDRLTDRVIDVPAPYVVDRLHLLNGIVRALGLQAIRTRDASGGAAAALHVFGYERDIERVEMLFTSLLIQALNGMHRGRPARGESLVRYRKAWLSAFTDVIERRLTECEQHARQEAEPSSGGRSVELVLADRASLAKARLKAAYPRSTTTTRTTRGSGLVDGAAAGRRADLGQTRIDPTRRAIGA